MNIKQEYLDQLINITGYKLYKINFLGSEENPNELIFEIHKKEKKFKCPCGREYERYYDCEERLVRDLSFGIYKYTFISFIQYRVECDECGVKTEELLWVEPRVDYTKRLAAAVALSCCELRPIQSIAKEYKLNWKTVKNIDKKAIEKRLPKLEDCNIEEMAVDEFSIKKGHKYATSVVDSLSRKIVHISEGRTEESLSLFYKKLGKEKCEKIKAIAMDMWKPYEAATRKYCPNGEIVYDAFHLIQSYGRDVIDLVRIKEYKKANETNKEIIKGTKYILLKNKENLEKEKAEHITLEKLLQCNKRLNMVYILKEDFKELWKYKSEKWFMKAWSEWNRRAMYSKIPELKKFALKIKNHLSGIVSHCKYRISTGVLEGINNKIKVIKRIAFGFRDMKYFFLKIQGSFHPIHTEGR